MRESLKKIIVIALALAMAVSMIMPAFAAKSPTKGKTPITKDMVRDSKTKKNIYKVYKSGYAHLKSLKVPKKKSATVPSTITYKGVTYKVNWIRANAFCKNSKLRTITIKGNIKTINKHAFKGSKIKTVKFACKKAPKLRKGSFKKCKVKTVKVSKKMSKSAYKKFKKALRKAGFKGKIKRY